MSSLVVGLYDDLDVAEQVVDDLLNNEIPGDNITMILNDDDDEDQFYVIQASPVDEADYEDEYEDEDEEEYEEIEDTAEVEAWDLMDLLGQMGLAEEEANYYAEEVRRGRTMISVNVPGDKLDQVKMIINQYFPIDMRERPVGEQASGGVFSSNRPGAN